MDNETNDGGVSLYKFNEDQFYKMSEVGILPWDGTEELLAGVVWDRSPLVRNRCHPSLNGGNNSLPERTGRYFRGV